MPRPRADRARPPPSPTTTGQRLAYGHHARVFDVAPAPAGASHVSGWLASASEDETVRLWAPRESSASDGDAARPPPTDYTQAGLARGHGEPVLRVAWAPSGDLLASAGADCCARVWRVASGGDATTTLAQAACLGPATEEGYACEFVDGAAHLLTTDGADVAVWDVGTGVRAPQVGPPPQPEGDTTEFANPRWAEAHVFGVALAPGPRLAVGACSDGAARLWSIDRDGATPVAAARPFSGVAAGAAWLTDSTTAVLVATDGGVAALEARAVGRGPVWRATLATPVAGVAAARGGVAVATGAGRVILLSGVDGSVTGVLTEGRVPGARALLCVAGGVRSSDAVIAAGEPVVDTPRDAGGAPARVAKWAPVTVWSGGRELVG